MELLTNAQMLLVFACSFLVSIWFLRWRAFYRRLPPTPWYIPLLGSPQLYSSSMHLQLTKTGQKYGGIYTLHMTTSPLVVLSSYSAIKAALVRQAVDFSDRFTFPFSSKELRLEGSVLLSNGIQWSARRRVAMTALRSFGVGTRSLENRVNEEARYLCDATDRNCGTPFDPIHIVKSAVSNIVCTISYGQRYDYNDPVFRTLLVNLDTIFRASAVKTILFGMPFLNSLPPLNKLKYAYKALTKFNEEMVQAHRATFDPDNIRDMIDAFILEGDKHQEEGDKLKEVFREDLIWRAIHDMFAAGTDTTTYTILWLILLMMEYPDVQTKVQSEVDNVIGQSRPPSLTDRAQMPYTEATLMEVQRFRTVAPYVPPRAVPRDVEIMGYSIPKGTQVWVNLWGALNDPSHWSNPECFDPSRFLSDDGEHVIVPEAYIPFGAGRRACLGETLAKMELFLFCTNFMQRFTFIRNSTTPLDLSGRIGITFIPRSYETVVVRR
ncbi:cytochrome P450 2U1-like isoform X1 [Acanthaster planci]|uniref:Cytochrome P450 2U1-like isoform X1 n=1 Tax=Acanthaster planci TaxID=133434 RepID=A0A8B7ZJX4_ACAPL|nr:cytochrome P450 2U1-like isoform X1 [Acanthaster planci]